MPGFEVFGEEEKRQTLEVFDTGVLFRYEFGPQRKGVYKVREFEQAFAQYTGADHAQAVTSGTAALKVALAALVHQARELDIALIDCQMTTGHLLRFGARELAGNEFQALLDEHIHGCLPQQPWQLASW